jgi:hypothetical protein
MEADELDLGGNVDGGNEHEIVGILRANEGRVKSVDSGILVTARRAALAIGLGQRGTPFCRIFVLL